MSSVPRTQTAFRLKNDLLERLKVKARKEKVSLNTYVENTLEANVGKDLIFPRLPKDFGISQEARSFACIGHLSEEYKGLSASEQAALDRELKIKHLIEKYGD